MPSACAGNMRKERIFLSGIVGKGGRFLVANCVA